MSTSLKLLILTWIVIGFVLFGVVGFYLGKASVQREIERAFPPPQQGQGGQQIPPSGGIQQMQKPSGILPSGIPNNTQNPPR